MDKDLPPTPRNVICQICKNKVPFKKTSLYKTGLDKQGEPPYCNACLEERGVLVADWKKQNTTNGYLCYPWPHIYYYEDYEIICNACHQTFVFTAEEQKFWYETAKIYTDVSPKMCATCRKKSRKVSPISQQIQRLLIQLKTNPSKQLCQQLSKLYLALGNKAKAGVYEAMAKRYLS